MKELKDYGRTSVLATMDIDFILKNGETYILGTKKINEYITTYPKIEVPLQLMAARQWLIDNPTRRKTTRGMGKYINGWLQRAQEKQVITKNKSNGFANIDF